MVRDSPALGMSTQARVLVTLALAALVAVGLVGAGRYVWTFWRYRGFPPPAAPAMVTDIAGRQVAVIPAAVQNITVTSPALGGRPDPVVVVLPPGYAAEAERRYPVIYLLHGVPGRPGDFLSTGDVAVVEAELVAERRMPPAILVLPSGSTSLLTDEEWADGIRPGNKWEDFVAADLVQAIDARYRTIPSGGSRAIAGISEGGYGALNIGLHHLGEFGVLESWSGYMVASDVPAIFGNSAARLAYNSPAVLVRRLAPELRRQRILIWFYCGTSDYTVDGNRRFDAELTALRLAHAFTIEPGLHTWKLWRTMMDAALVTASRQLGHD